MKIFLLLAYVASIVISFQLGKLTQTRKHDADAALTVLLREQDLATGTPIAAELAREMGITLRAVADLERDIANFDQTLKAGN